MIVIFYKIVQLKNFIQGASFDPTIDNNYFARAKEDDEDFLDSFDSAAKFIVPFFVVGSVMATIITICLILIHVLCGGNDRKINKLQDAARIQNANKSSLSKIFSIAATTFLVNVYALALSFTAVINTDNEIYEISEHHVYVKALPYIVFIVDALGVGWWLLWYVVSCISLLRYYRNGDQNGNIQTDILLAIYACTLGPILSFTIHIPYITIAYLNDGVYATSILIYYLITIFVVFGTLNSTCSTCFSAIIHRRNPQPDINVHWCWIFVPHIILIPILGLAGMIAAVLMTIPITRAFSDAPSRLQGFYQTAAVIVGVYILYWKFYQKQPSIDSVISERQGRFHDQARLRTRWDTLSKDERVEEFYATFIDIVMNNYYYRAPFVGENNQLRDSVADQLLHLAYQQLLSATHRLQVAYVQLKAANQNATIEQLLQANNHLRNANWHLQTANRKLLEGNLLQAANPANNEADQVQAARRQLEAANLQLQAASLQQRASQAANLDGVGNRATNQQEAANNQQQAANGQQGAANAMLERIQAGNNPTNEQLETLRNCNNTLRDRNNELHTANDNLATAL